MWYRIEDRLPARSIVDSNYSVEVLVYTADDTYCVDCYRYLVSRFGETKDVIAWTYIPRYTTAKHSTRHSTIIDSTVPDGFVTE